MSLNKLLTKLLILFVIDICLLGTPLYFSETEPSEALGLLIIVPFVFVIDMLVWFALLSRQSKWALPVLINSLLAPAISATAFNWSADRYISNHYRSYYFRKNNMQYEISIHLVNGELRSGEAFGISQRTDIGSSTSFIDGQYYVRQDSIRLEGDRGQRLTIKNNLLVDDSNPSERIALSSSEHPKSPP